LALVAYSVRDAGGMHLTRNFAESIVSNAMLIGSKVDKLLSLPP